MSRSCISAFAKILNKNLKCFQVVDEDVGQPEVVDKLQVDGEHGVDVGDVEVAEIGVGDVEAGLLPHHVEVAGELDTVLLVWSKVTVSPNSAKTFTLSLILSTSTISIPMSMMLTSLGKGRSNLL